MFLDVFGSYGKSWHEQLSDYLEQNQQEEKDDFLKNTSKLWKRTWSLKKLPGHFAASVADNFLYL